MDQQTGKYILIAGVILIFAGTIIYFFHGSLKWMGRLPGDIRVEKGNFRFYFPVVTLLIFSIIVTLLVHIIRRFL